MNDIELGEIVEIKGDLRGYGIVCSISKDHDYWTDFFIVKLPSGETEGFSAENIYKIKNPITKFFQTRRFNKLFKLQSPKDNKACKTFATEQ